MVSNGLTDVLMEDPNYATNSGPKYGYLKKY